MKKTLFVLTTLLCFFIDTTWAQKEVSGVYVGGHIRRERPKTITTLRNSGFTYVILFNVHVESDGTLTTDGETICKNGEYVFQETQPHYQQDVADLKTPPTSISRIEICIGGWGNTSYENIKNLINKNGTGKNTMLYKNFKALKEAVPEIDAVNNDDEHCYDANTAAKFHLMMYNLGYKTTLAPYTYSSFWQSLASQVRATRTMAIDRVMIQCYDGGAGNNPADWNFPGIKTRHAGRTNYQTDMNKSIAQMESWKKSGAASGGFVWVYNDETWNLNAWASAMNRTFEAVTIPEDSIVVKAYSESNYNGYCVNLPEGTFSQADLALRGLAANDLSSLEIVKEGYRIRLYKSPTCVGTYRQYPRSVRMLSIYDNTTCAIDIIPVDTEVEQMPNASETLITQVETGISVQNARGQQIGIYNSTGQLVYCTTADCQDEIISTQTLPHGVYVVRVGDKSLKISR